MFHKLGDVTISSGGSVVRFNSRCQMRLNSNPLLSDTFRPLVNSTALQKW